MQPSQPRNDNEQPASLRQDAGTVVMRSVVSHDRLLKMIEERNPILAQRKDRRD